jgi:hypothetical protein
MPEFDLTDIQVIACDIFGTTVEARHVLNQREALRAESVESWCCGFHGGFWSAAYR